MDDEIQASPAEQARPHGCFQKCLDRFHYFRGDVINRLAYASLRFYGFENVSLADVKRGAYDNMHHRDLDLKHIDNTDSVLSRARECFDEAQKRRAAITDKCKTLLTISSILLGLIGLLLPKSFAFDADWMRPVCFVAILGLFNVIVLLLTFFAVGRECRLALDQSDIVLAPEDFAKSSINLYLQCQVASDNRTNYLVDLYKVARFFFLAAFSLVVILFSVSFFFDSAQNDAKEIIRELRSDPELIELFRGPAGAQGATGDPGKDALVDETRLIKQLVNDPRLTTIIEESVGERIQQQLTKE